MQQSNRPFGVLPEEITYTAHNVEIRPLPDAGQRIAMVLESDRVYRNWVYPLIDKKIDQRGGAKREIDIHAEAFSLIETHEIRTRDGAEVDSEMLEFLIVLFGFVKGLRLNPEGWVHFYRTPVRIGELTDFTASRGRAEDALKVGENYWRTHGGTSVVRNMFGAIHWYLFCQSYAHPFEVFEAQYRVLDTCWRLFVDTHPGAPVRKPPHAERAKILCDTFAIPQPTWIVNGDLASLRNDLEHEARFAGSPIGFTAVPAAYPAIHHQLAYLNARLIVALLGMDSDYIRTSVESMQRNLL